MRKITIVLFLLTMLPGYAQTLYKAKIMLANGEIKDGYANLPSNSLLSGSVTFKPEKKGKGTKIKKDDIQNAVYYADNGNEFYFECTIVKQLLGKHELRPTKKKSWIVATYSNPDITVYSFGESYYIDKEGAMVTKSGASGTWAEIFVCLRRPGEEVPTSITAYNFGAAVIGHDAKFRNASKKYFEGETKFIERIENKEWEHEQVREMAEAYAAYKKGE